jgi:uncharacterized protein YlxP (DUF503 family)
MYVAVVLFELHLPTPRSLKAKRALVKPIVEGLRRRHSVSVAEVDHHDTWQRTAVGAAVVASSYRHAEDILDDVERFVWSRPDVQVLDVRRSWLEPED